MSIHLKYFVPNGFTALSMVLGLASVACSAAGNYELAAWMVLWGVLLDKLDGSAARLLKASSEFGGQLDSFADFVAFGIAPSALVFFYLQGSATYAGPMAALLYGACGFFVVATSTRLARFNISEPPGGKAFFFGVPTTLIGATLAAGFLTVSRHLADPGALLQAAPLILVVAGASMVSSVRIPKLQLRQSKAWNLFQIGNIVAAYVLATLRLAPEYLFVLAMGWIVVGAAWALLHPAEAPEVQPA